MRQQIIIPRLFPVLSISCFYSFFVTFQVSSHQLVLRLELKDNIFCMCLVSTALALGLAIMDLAFVLILLSLRVVTISLDSVLT